MPVHILYAYSQEYVCFRLTRSTRSTFLIHSRCELWRSSALDGRTQLL